MNMSVDPEGMKDATTNAFFSTEKKNRKYSHKRIVFLVTLSFKKHRLCYPERITEVTDVHPSFCM